MEKIEKREFRLLYMVMRTKEEAVEIGRELVTRKLVACVNILPKATSIYKWRGNLIEESEVIMLAKTQVSLVKQVESVVRKMHAYDCPCVISLTIEAGLPEYLDWVEKETSNS